MIRSRRFNPSAPPRFVPLLAIGLIVAIYLGSARVAYEQCTRPGGQDGPAPNVFWGLKDSVAACPAGDTLIGLNPPASIGPRPSLLRISVFYYDLNDCPRVGVPPESIWVTTSTVEGNLIVNDMGQKTFADDSTDANGFTRITLRSFSGCGKTAVTLRVSGISQGTIHASVRTADTLAAGRVADIDKFAMCDLDYDGIHGGGTELSAALAHVDHWHRQALHGTLVRRTNLCETCGRDANNGIGEGDISWSHDGRRIAYSSRDTCPACNLEKNPCRVKIVPSDPSWGNSVRNLTFNGAPGDSMDYDTSWSPLGGTVYFIRHDQVIYKKGVPGLNPDTSLVALIGDGVDKVDAHVSPDGDSLAYDQSDGTHFQVFIAPVTGGSARQVTSDPVNHFFVEWSADGAALIVTDYTSNKSLWKIRVRGPANPQSFYAPTDKDAQWPCFAPDTQTVVAGVGPTGAPTVHVLDGTVASTTTAIENYPEYTDGQLYTRYSPDGTRLALLARDPRVSGATMPQLFAARRNMSLPPQITSVGGVSLADSTASLTFTVNQGSNPSYVVAASDPEGDTIFYHAFFMQSWMSFDSTTRTLTVSPGGTAGSTYNVVVHVATLSGGTDAVIAQFHVCPPGGCTQPGNAQIVGTIDGPAGVFPNPTRGRFSIATPRIHGEAAELAIFDLSGRRVALVRGPAGSKLEWDATGHPDGIYLYRLRAGSYRSEGKVVHVR